MSDLPQFATSVETANLIWSDDLVTGHPAMDATHREFVAVVNELVSASDGVLLERLRDFEVHARAHFGTEDALMRSTSYPSAGCHTDEHAAVLTSVADVIALVAQGHLAIGRDLADELERWFPAHTHHMDKSLADWLCKQSTGGSPVVLRRGKAGGVGAATRAVRDAGESGPASRHESSRP